MYRMAVVLVLSLGCAAVQVRPEDRPITNPVIPGDLPDPSVIRVGDDYWATGTSSEWAPQFPLFHSRDLVTWEQVGAVFQTPPSWSEANYWAPELVEDHGQFFVYFAARKKGGPLCVGAATAEKPQGPWTDRGPIVCDPDGSIDGALVRDERGVPYLLWKQDGNSHGAPTPIWAQQLAEDRVHFAEGSTRAQLIVNDAPWEGGVVEGGMVIRRDGWFYLFYAGGACCGRECNYGEGVARSRALLSGWEKSPANPISKTNAAWTCPGHGTVVTDAAGRSYLMHHAYSARDTVYVGRQSILAPLTWSADGWPSVAPGQGTAGPMRAPPAFSDDFGGASLLPGWQWPAGHPPQASVSGGLLTLAPDGAVLARSTHAGQYDAVAVVDPGAPAGLAAYGDPESSVGIRLAGGALEVWRREKNAEQVLHRQPAPAGARLHLKMTARDGHLFRFAASADGASWTGAGGEVDGAFLPPWDRGVRVALVAGGPSARFDALTITPRP